MNTINKSKHFDAIQSIQKKLLGKKLSYKEIYNLMDKISKNNLGDILTTYFIAASFKEGFNDDELYEFTRAMVETGTKIKFDGIIADKHSIGGVAGTRTTLIVVPIIAEAGFKIPKTSSRAITTPAGTADVMEVMAKVTFTPGQIKKIVDEVGACIVWGGHLGIAPADDKIIDIEEELSFESFDKIIVSIMAKKVAMSVNHLILDVPIGSTMKIRNIKDAEKVETKFKRIANKFDIKIKVDINEINEPAGSGIGPFLEARDALYVLEQKKDRPMYLEKKAIKLALELLKMCYKTSNIEKDPEKEIQNILTSGRALNKFRQIVHAQGGIKNISSENLKIKASQTNISSDIYGKIKKVNNYNLNMIAKLLGAPKDKQAGIYLNKRIEDKVNKNEKLLTLYSSEPYKIKEATETLKNFPIYEISK
ncbi:MAG: thymidine phosphorylase [Candidatus Woesebacteria bacterium]|nr:thymidine phosphorylase [Candidatus Woesebacteria bacterium]